MVKDKSTIGIWNNLKLRVNENIKSKHLWHEGKQSIERYL